MPLSEGTRLGPYEILAPIGAGGMGEVYRARDTRLDRTVAVKVLPSHLSFSPTLKQRFEREARSVSSLNHPNICALYDVGQQDGADYIVMEHLEGETLAERIERGPVPVRETIAIVIQIADALDKAHKQGVIHRDLKPGNIMLTKSGAKLLDFGLAKSVGPGGSPGAPAGMTMSPTMTSPLTAEGSIVGTFHYMAPELLEGGEADARSDIFAFGLMLYEMLTGKKAFGGKTQASLIAAILKETPRPLTSLLPVTPPALERLVQTCLEKDPEDRRQTMHDVLLELKWIAEAGPEAGVGASGAATAPGRERIWMGVSAALAVVAVAAIVITIARAPGDAPSGIERPIHAALLPPPGGSFVSVGGTAGPVEISPDGTRLVFGAATADGGHRLYLRSLESGAVVPLQGTEGGARPFWSPDSRFIGFFAGGKLKKLELAGSTVLTIAAAADGRGGAWNENGTIVFAPSFRGALLKIPATGGDPDPVTELDTSRVQGTHRYPVFLPDQKHFLYLARSTVAGTPEDTKIYAGSLDGGDAKEIIKAESNAVYANGYLLFTRERTLLAQGFDPDTLEVKGDPVAIANDIQVDSVYSRAVFSASPNGVLVYQTGQFEDKSRLVWLDPKGEELGTLGDPAAFLTLQISPDGGQVIASITEPGPGRNLWLYDRERGVRTRLTFTPDVVDAYGVWSPSGDELVFTSTQVGPMQIFRKSTSGSGEAVRMVEESADAYPTSWSRDGRFVLYTALGHGPSDSARDIWYLSVEEGGKPTPYIQTRFEEDSARFSPDDAWVAYVSDQSGRNEVYVAPFPDPSGRWQVSTNGGTLPRWRGDGREIYYLSPEGEMMAAQVDALPGGFRVGQPRALFRAQIHAGAWEAYDVTADGKRFLVNTRFGQANLSPMTLVLNWTAQLGR